MQRLFSNPLFACLLVIGACAYASAQYPASAELDRDEVLMTRAELNALIVRERIETARKVMNAHECGWREFLTERKKS